MAGKTTDLDDILGTETQETRKAVRGARLKALASKGDNMAKKPAAAAAAAEEPTKPTRARKNSKNEPEKPTKKATITESNGAAKPRRKPEWEDGESDRMLAAVTKVMAKTKKINSKELAEKIGYAGQMHKVRPVLARAVSAGVLTITPGESPAHGTTLIAK